ncbi:MAG: chromosomal replication initiator protein DnaA, partial [Clostridia bacterium]|nr:chromosomal replication initiator protein DnaA [Clostridia bacterium]
YDITYISSEDIGKVEQDLLVPSVHNQNMKTNLNPKYTFSTFVIGDNNRFAQAAAFAVAEAPGMSYNPLFIYGGVGLGKTHLVHAIGNEILKRSPKKKIIYVTSEKFTNEFINGIKDNSNENFRQKYRNVDVLIIDDIQFIAGKEGIQEEFFHTFNAIRENNGQIILTSDKPPKDINPLEERLKSRFVDGLLVDISNANYETRLAILRQKVQLESIVIDDIVLSNIATKIDTNIRELEGTLNKIVAKATLTHSPITFELAEKAIADVIAHKEKVISSDYIKETVSKYFNIDVKDMDSSKRSNDIAFPRQIAMYLCRELAKMQYKNIGNNFGNRDHSTVMHACSKIEQEIKKNKETFRHVDNLKNFILQTKEV